jgi:hypothetical protein
MRGEYGTKRFGTHCKGVKKIINKKNPRVPRGRNLNAERFPTAKDQLK